MAIILDAMGSDKRPEPEVIGAIEAARMYGEEILLVGNEQVLLPALKAAGVGDLPITVIHASEAIDMTDKIEQVRAKKDNSMRVGMDLLAAGRGSAFVTAGSTGMAMYHAMKSLSADTRRPSACAFHLVSGERRQMCRPRYWRQCRMPT